MRSIEVAGAGRNCGGGGPKASRFLDRWRPWTATMALLVPLGVLLSWQSFLTSGRNATTLWLYFNNWDSGLLALPAFRHDFPLFLAATLYELLTLASWSWAAGFAVGSLSPKKAPLNGLLLFLLLCCGALWGSLWQANLPGQHGPVFQNLFYRAIFPLLVQMSLVLLPALFGMGAGVRLPRFPPALRITLGSSAFLSLAILVVLSAHRVNETSSATRLVHLAANLPVLYWIVTGS